MIIKRPLTEEQKKALELPSVEDRLQALDEFINYAGLKLLELEEKQNPKPTVEYTC
ncbi:MAG: hypothetical protein IKI76_03145 [Selenomonadaceae bacterium]|nr:hypothetical protein [Selenomonadaceae bacterium]